MVGNWATHYQAFVLLCILSCNRFKEKKTTTQLSNRVACAGDASFDTSTLADSNEMLSFFISSRKCHTIWELTTTQLSNRVAFAGGVKKDNISLESTSVDVSKDASASDMQVSDTEDSAKHATEFGSSKRTNTRSEASRGPGRKASRFFRSMVHKGKLTAAEVDELSPEERKPLHKEMQHEHARSSQFTTEIIQQHIMPNRLNSSDKIAPTS